MILCLRVSKFDSVLFLYLILIHAMQQSWQTKISTSRMRWQRSVFLFLSLISSDFLFLIYLSVFCESSLPPLIPQKRRRRRRWWYKRMQMRQSIPWLRRLNLCQVFLLKKCFLFLFNSWAKIVWFFCCDLLVTVSDGLESSFTGLKKKKKKPVSWSAL